MFKSVLTDSVIAASDIAPNRFVGVNGDLGGNYGVTLYGGEANRPIDVVVLGIAEVEVASEETIQAGDLVKSDTEGKAVKDNTSGIYLARTGGTAGELIEVLIR